MKCPKCNKEVSHDWKLCPFCGFEPKKCSNPGCQPRWLPQEAKFCPECGRPIMGNNIATATNDRCFQYDSQSITNDVVDKMPECFTIKEGVDFVFTIKGVSFKMVFVKGGIFQMGATSEQGLSFGFDFLDARKPTHTVVLSDYYLGESVVTRELWNNVTGGNPLKANEVNFPKDQISWFDCDVFIRKLNQITGKMFRLPTESEWEYAARGGTNSLYLYRYAGDNDIDAVAWYEKNSNDKIHPVMTKKPNKLGLYDMSGNVHEWCSDWHGKYSSQQQTNPQGPLSGRWRICRGGCFGSLAVRCEVAVRDSFPPEFEGPGFRLALSV